MVSPSLSDMIVVAVAALWWRMTVTVAALRWGCDLFSGAEFNFFVFLCLFVVCSSWLYHSTYNTLEDMIDLWWQMVGNLTMHFPSQHSWLTYRGTGTCINVRHLDWWAGSKNWSKIFDCYGASLGGVQRVRLTSRKPHKKHKQHDKQNHPLAPPAAWIWWTHAAWGVGGLAHVCSNSAVEAIL
jgi:hypothetical protein